LVWCCSASRGFAMDEVRIRPAAGNDKQASNMVNVYVIVKRSYGKERYYSIISQGVRVRATWTESLELAERFVSAQDASEAIAGTDCPARAYVRSVLPQ